MSKRLKKLYPIWTSQSYVGFVIIVMCRSDALSDILYSKEERWKTIHLCPNAPVKVSTRMDFTQCFGANACTRSGTRIRSWTVYCHQCAGPYKSRVCLEYGSQRLLSIVDFPYALKGFFVVGHTEESQTILALICTESPRQAMKITDPKTNEEKWVHVAMGPRVLASRFSYQSNAH